MASLADRFVAVMARINAINPDNDEPMRHQVRAMRQAAEAIIGAALTQANELTYAAHGIKTDADAAADEAIAAYVANQEAESP